MEPDMFGDSLAGWVLCRVGVSPSRRDVAVCADAAAHSTGRYSSSGWWRTPTGSPRPDKMRQHSMASISMPATWSKPSLT